MKRQYRVAGCTLPFSMYVALYATSKLQVPGSEWDQCQYWYIDIRPDQ